MLISLSITFHWSSYQCFQVFCCCLGQRFETSNVDVTFQRSISLIHKWNNERVSAGDTEISLHTPVPYTKSSMRSSSLCVCVCVCVWSFQKSSMKSSKRGEGYSRTKFLSRPWEVAILGEVLLDKVSKSSMKSSDKRGVGYSWALPWTRMQEVITR